MKQFLIFLLTLLLNLPSYAGSATTLETNSDITDSYPQEPVTTTKHQHQHMMSNHSDDRHSTATAKVDAGSVPKHDCCGDSSVAKNHVNMDCNEECLDCNHGCGACIALLPESGRELQPQAGQTQLATVQLPVSPYQNPLIPPIISK